MDDSLKAHCYFAALDALKAGADPFDAAKRSIRPSGWLTWLETHTAIWEARKAREDFYRDRAKRVLAHISGETAALDAAE